MLPPLDCLLEAIYFLERHILQSATNSCLSRVYFAPRKYLASSWSRLDVYPIVIFR